MVKIGNNPGPDPTMFIPKFFCLFCFLKSACLLLELMKGKITVSNVSNRSEAGSAAVEKSAKKRSSNNRDASSYSYNRNSRDVSSIKDTSVDSVDANSRKNIDNKRLDNISRDMRNIMDAYNSSDDNNCNGSDASNS